MTNPASPEPLERCADCLRPKATDSQDYYKSAYFPEVAPSERKCPAHLGEAYRYDCHELTITRLRSELASVRALSEAERAVVDASIEWRKWMLATSGDDALVELVGMLSVIHAVDALLALRKAQAT